MSTEVKAGLITVRGEPIPLKGVNGRAPVKPPEKEPTAAKYRPKFNDVPHLSRPERQRRDKH